MRISYATYIAGIAAMVVVILSYSPMLLTADSLPQNVLPTPVLTSISNAFSVQVASASTTQVSQAPATKTVAATNPKTITYPRLVIPSIGLNDPIVPEGVTAAGAMAVPNGKTDQVGWWDGGPKPGDVGSAVLDAHVFAAFSGLNEVAAGDSIYVEMSPTETLHFVVTKTETYALSQITSQDLFVSTQNRDLNLITCAGKLTPDHSTYDHRLVVYSTLEN